MRNDKIASYVGFAVRANKIVRGIDAITAKHKRYPLILLSKEASPRSAEKLREYAGDTVPLFEVDNLAELSHLGGCMALAICEKQIARAIIEEFSSKE